MANKRADEPQTTLPGRVPTLRSSSEYSEAKLTATRDTQRGIIGAREARSGPLGGRHAAAGGRGPINQQLHLAHPLST